MKNLIYLFMMLILLTILSACGLKGPLYLPMQIKVTAK